MKSPYLVIRSQRVLLDENSEPQPASIQIIDGKICKIGRSQDRFETEFDLDFGDHLISPGIVDTHAHVNEPGRTEWEGFQTATRAAAAGGITTVIDMPLNSIPATTSVDALRVKARAASGQCWIDYGFWGGVIPGNLNELERMIHEGVTGFKCFLIDSGVPEFPAVDEAVLRESMPILAQAKLPLIVHAELETLLPTMKGQTPVDHPQSYSTYLHSRPPQWEVSAIRMMIRLSQETGCAVHIVHLSAADALDDIRKAKERGLPITAETCPHYLTLSAEEIPDGATLFKCAPPIREQENRERLWGGLIDGTLDCIVSDHSPCLPSLKEMDQGDFQKAWGGISGIQLSMAAVWTEMRKRGLPVSLLSKWMSQNPARLAGISERKGSIRCGMDADLIIWNPEVRQTVHANQIYHRHSSTPYEGREFYGTVLKTFVRGHLVYDFTASSATVSKSGPSGVFSGDRVGHYLRRQCEQPK